MRIPPGAIMPAVYLTGTAVLAYLAWRAYKSISGAAGAALDAAGQWAQVQAAEVSGAASELANAYRQGRDGIPEKTARQILYSDEGYAGIDGPTGRNVIEGDAYADVEMRRYLAQQRDAIAERNRDAAPGTPAIVAPVNSIDGAAFGVYPSAGRRRPQPQQ